MHDLAVANTRAHARAPRLKSDGHSVVQEFAAEGLESF